MTKMELRKAAFAVAVASAAALPLAATAATEAQKQTAIDGGLAWLASQQGANGSWCQSGYCAADTAAALLAFTEQKYKPLGWNDPVNPNKYASTVTNAVNFLLKDAGTVAISNDRGDGNNPNISGSNTGYIWGGGESTYVTGLVLPALARVTAGVNGITPTTAINLPGFAVDGKTYAQVIQDTVATFANGQTRADNAAWAGARGGWRYTPSDGQSDGSTAQWPAIGMLFAEQVPGVTVPGFVKSELTHWMDYIQNTNGGVGYDNPGNLVNESKTGGLLVQMAFTGYNGDSSGAGDASDRAGALAYLNTHWQDGANGWDGNFGQPYSMWSVYKGLESTIGLTDTTAITNLHPQGGALLDAGDTWNWYEDYAQSLVDTQNTGDGSWGGYYYWPQSLATAWNINILNATQVGPGPNPVPEPASIALVGLALVGLVVSRRRKGG